MWMWPTVRLPLLALLLSPLLGCVPAAQPSATVARAELARDRDVIRVVAATGEPLLRYTLPEWRRWAEANLTRALGGPVMIGENERPPSTFDGFGAARLSPAQDRLAFSATTYAMLTTVSVVHLLDLEEQDLSVVRDPPFGSVRGFHWSPDGHYLAYALGTARADGDRLRIDDARRLEPAVELDGQKLIEAARRSGREVAAEARQWLPQVRQLEWSESGRLLFTTDEFDGGGELRWSVDPATGSLALL